MTATENGLPKGYSIGRSTLGWHWTLGNTTSTAYGDKGAAECAALLHYYESMK